MAAMTIAKTPATPVARHASGDFAGWAAEAGVTLDPVQLARFARYRDLLVDWSGRVNLTAITDPIEIERRLFLDGLRLVPLLDEVSVASPRLLDVGAGAGFPGLPLKIARPAIELTLLEATGKKVRFLEAAIAALELDGARAIHGRAEDLGHDPAFRERFDLVTARAVATLPALMELCLPMLRVGGVALFPKGLSIEAEVAAGGRAAALLGGRLTGVRAVPGGTTSVVTATKDTPTPPAYPRRAGLPARAPLGMPVGESARGVA
jgi:16S rRNA (guanine527-N7)-methyltransferase